MAALGWEEVCFVRIAPFCSALLSALLTLGLSFEPLTAPRPCRAKRSSQLARLSRERSCLSRPKALTAPGQGHPLGKAPPTPNPTPPSPLLRLTPPTSKLDFLPPGRPTSTHRHRLRRTQSNVSHNSFVVEREQWAVRSISRDGAERPSAVASRRTLLCPAWRVSADPTAACTGPDEQGQAESSCWLGVREPRLYVRLPFPQIPFCRRGELAGSRRRRRAGHDALDIVPQI